MKHAVIMAGGSGTRFWPLSRQSLPKQFLRVAGDRHSRLVQSADSATAGAGSGENVQNNPPAGDRSLIQSTFDRCRPEIEPDHFWVVTNARQADITRQQLPEIPAEHVLVEPCGRNTAPCIGLAAIHLLQRDPDAVMLIMPADHVISPPAAFRQIVNRAERLTETDPRRLVLFGVTPTYAATGFGYIERGDALADEQDAYAVASFREKPDAHTADQYIRSGRFYWNCGIFVWRAATILESLAEHEPDIHSRLMTLSKNIGKSDWDAVLNDEFPRMPSISIDYSVLERAEDICLLEAPFEWDDVGSWQALSRLHEQDADGNTVVGTHCGVDTSGCIIRSEGDHLIATLGARDLIIVHTPDATLVASRRDENAVRDLVAKLEESGDERYL